MLNRILIIFILLMCWLESDCMTHFDKVDNDDPYFLNQLIWVESRNKPHAISHRDAYGLMQITQPVLDDYYTFVGKKYNIDQMLEIKPNLEVGRWHLKRLLKEFNCDVTAVSAYNMGQGNTYDDVYNLRYTINILGTNRVLSWLKGKTATRWKGTYSCYVITSTDSI